MIDNDEIKILRLFKNNLVVFMDELISQLPLESDLLIARIFLNDQVPIKDVMEWFVHQLVHVREMITNRSDNYFISNTSIFTQLSPDKVNNFKKIWISGQLDEGNKDVIWKWIDSFVYLSDKYTKTKVSS
jgi:hypothetical protein